VKRLANVAVCLVLAAAAAGCGETTTAYEGLGPHSGEPDEEATREGLAIEFEDVEYNVLITRELNLRDVEDQGYVDPDVEEAPPGSAYYGVFLRACNTTGDPVAPSARMRIVDTQENFYEPTRLSADNPFAYQSRELQPEECLPASGSVADTGPTGGSLVLFEVPLEAIENRPLELEILGDYNLTEREQEFTAIELDI